MFFQGCVTDPLHIYPDPKWSVLLLRIVRQDAMSEVLEVRPQSELEICVDDIQIHVWEEIMKSCRRCRKTEQAQTCYQGSKIESYR